MKPTDTSLLPAVTDQVYYHLLRLRVPVYLSGYTQLCIGIPLFMKDPTQTMCCELYPAIAKVLGYYDWRAVEYSIRRAILAAWEHRDEEIWTEYFPGLDKAPTNKQFIATVALKIK